MSMTRLLPENDERAHLSETLEGYVADVTSARKYSRNFCSRRNRGSSPDQREMKSETCKTGIAGQVTFGTIQPGWWLLRGTANRNTPARYGLGNDLAYVDPGSGSKTTLPWPPQSSTKNGD